MQSSCSCQAVAKHSTGVIGQYSGIYLSVVGHLSSSQRAVGGHLSGSHWAFVGQSAGSHQEITSNRRAVIWKSSDKCQAVVRQSSVIYKNFVINYAAYATESLFDLVYTF
jgi:hypothetical protein